MPRIKNSGRRCTGKVVKGKSRILQLQPNGIWKRPRGVSRRFSRDYPLLKRQQYNLQWCLQKYFTGFMEFMNWKRDLNDDVEQYVKAHFKLRDKDYDYHDLEGQAFLKRSCIRKGRGLCDSLYTHQLNLKCKFYKCFPKEYIDIITNKQKVKVEINIEPYELTLKFSENSELSTSYVDFTKNK